MGDAGRETPAPGAQRAGKLFGELSEETAALVRREVEVARDQAADRIKRSVAGVGLLAGATVLGGLALGTLSAGLVRALDRALPERNGALAVTLLYGTLAGALGAAGVRELRRHALAAPEQAADAITGDVREARRRQEGYRP